MLTIYTHLHYYRVIAINERFKKMFRIKVKKSRFSFRSFVIEAANHVELNLNLTAAKSHGYHVAAVSRIRAV